MTQASTSQESMPLPPERIDENVPDAIALAIHGQQRLHANWANLDTKAISVAGVALAVAALVAGLVGDSPSRLEQVAVWALIAITGAVVACSVMAYLPRVFSVGPMLHQIVPMVELERAPRSWLLTMEAAELESAGPLQRKRRLVGAAVKLMAAQSVVALATIAVSVVGLGA